LAGVLSRDRQGAVLWLIDHYGMNYYEELGLAPSARAEEIRQAYKNLARLLHPDQQQDPQLRHLAECQMKRLNSIYAVLADTERRRRYDRELAGASGEPRPQVIIHAAPPVVRQTPTHLYPAILVSASLVIASGAAVWYLTQEAARVEVVYREPVPGPAVKVDPPSPSRPYNPAPDPGTRHTAVEPKSVRLPPATLPPNPLLGVQTAAAAETVPAARPALTRLSPLPEPELKPAPAPVPVRKGLAGRWLYVPPRVQSDSQGVVLYPPQYIELVITEANGLIRGRYHGRYQVLDKPISPNVNFTFEGKPAGTSASLLWATNTGATGEVHLKLVVANSLEVTWLAHQLGQELGLASGTATLVRAGEP